MQVRRQVDIAHLLFIVADDFDEVTHDITEESNTTKHDYHSNNSLHVAHREVVTITDSTQSCKRIVTTNNKLENLILFAELVVLDEAVLVFKIDLRVAKVPPEAANKVCDDASDHN